MSSCEVYAVRQNGEIEWYGDAHNSWGGAMHIWNVLAKKHLAHEVSIFGNMQPVWDLANDERVPEHERLVLASTFDRVICQKDKLPTLIDAMKEFCNEYPTSTLEAEILILEEINQNDEYVGVAWNQTSVSDFGLRGDYDEEEDERKPYNIFEKDDHWFL